MSDLHYCKTHDREHVGPVCGDCRDGKPSAFLTKAEQERIRLNVRKSAHEFIRTTEAVRSMYDAEGKLISPVPTREV